MEGGAAGPIAQRSVTHCLPTPSKIFPRPGMRAQEPYRRECVRVTAQEESREGEDRRRLAGSRGINRLQARFGVVSAARKRSQVLLRRSLEVAQCIASETSMPRTSSKPAPAQRFERHRGCRFAAKTQSPNLEAARLWNCGSFCKRCKPCASATFRCEWRAISWDVMGKVADTFNEIVAANQRMARQLERVGQVVGREGRTRQRVRFGLSEGAWGEMEILGQFADRRSTVADDRSDARHRRGGAGRSFAHRCARRRRPPAEGRVPALGRDRQHA